MVGEVEIALSLGLKEWAQIRLTGWSRPYNSRNGHVSFFQLNNIEWFRRVLKAIGETQIEGASYIVCILRGESCQ